MGRFFLGIIALSDSDSTGYVSARGCPVGCCTPARTQQHGIPAPHWQPSSSDQALPGMVLANQADSQTDLTVRVEHAVSGLLFVRAETSHLRRRAHVHRKFLMWRGIW